MTDAEKKREYKRKWKEANPDKVKAYAAKHREKRVAKQAEHYAANKESYLASHLKQKYGITVEQYDALREAAGHVCEICGNPVVRAYSGDKTNVACVDHCHTTGQVRGILCRQCNAWLGRVNDDPSRAINYLTRKA